MFEVNKVKGVLFDVYGTLIDIETDEETECTYKCLSNWLLFHGVKIDMVKLKRDYAEKVNEELNKKIEKYPEIKVEDIFEKICSENAMWKINEEEIGHMASMYFRSASLRHLQPYPENLKLLEQFKDLPKGIVSNGQRSFSERELKIFNLYDHFDFIIFSSDVGFKKPDERIFKMALEKLKLKADEVLFIGNSYGDDIMPSEKLGMQALQIEEARGIFSSRPFS